MAPVSQRRARAARAAAAAGVTTLLAGTAHTVAGAHAPSAFLLAVTIVLATPLGILLVRPRASLTRTVFSVAAAQAVFHAVFTLFAGPVVALPAAVHAHAGHGVVFSTAAAHTAHAGHAGSHALSPGMIAMHVVAGLATVVLLHFGERLLVAAGRGVRRLLPPPHAPRQSSPRPRPVFRVRGRLWHPTAFLPTGVTPWRGPPSVVVL